VKKKGQDATETLTFPVADIKIISRRPPCEKGCSCGMCRKKGRGKE